MDIQQIALELGVTDKTVRRLFNKFEDKTGTVVGHKPDKSDSRRKVYDLTSVNQALDFCGYPMVAVPEVATANVEPDAPNEINTERGWLTVSPKGEVVAPRSFDSDRHVARSTMAAKIENQGLSNLEMYVRHTAANLVAYRMSGMVGQIDAAFAGAARDLTASADGVFAEDQ